MQRFEYQARNKAGERVTGTRDAGDQRGALEALREEGLFVTKLIAAGRIAESTTVNGVTNGAANGASTNGHAANEDVLPSHKWELSPAETPREQPAKPHEKPTNERPGQRPAPSIPKSPPGQPGTNSPAHKPAAAPPIPPRLWLRSSTKDLALYFSQMHAMLNAGTSLGHALNTMATNACSKGLREASKEMAPRISSGQEWSTLMKSYPGIFTPLMTGMIRAGEVGGFLDRMCLRLSTYAERDYKLQQTIKSETWYPKLMVFCSLMIPSVVPAAIAWFQGKGVLAAWWSGSSKWVLFLILLFVLFKLKDYFQPLAKQLEPLVYFWDRVKLLTPISGKTTRALATAKFCRSLGALQAAGMGVQQTIHLSADACGNAFIAQSTRRIIHVIEGGATMTDALESTKQFPGIALQMLRTGEATGDFDGQLDKVADFLEGDAETTIKKAVVVVGILAFLAIALYVGYTVIQQYVTIYGGMIDKGIDMAN